MDSRTKILGAVKNVLKSSPLPTLSFEKNVNEDVVRKFTEILTTIGGAVIEISSLDEMNAFISERFNGARIVSGLRNDVFREISNQSPRAFNDVDITILKAHFGVAENGAVWVTDSLLADRVLPFICQHLMVVLNRDEIVSNMHEAYDRIGSQQYSFGTFIAGPSKTADIEQSLVLGAHGPKTMTVFLLDSGTAEEA